MTQPQHQQNKGVDCGLQEMTRCRTHPPSPWMELRWRANSFGFIWVQTSLDLTWTHHTDAITKRARQRLFFLHRLRRPNIDSMTLCNFHRRVNESILMRPRMLWELWKLLSTFITSPGLNCHSWRTSSPGMQDVDQHDACCITRLGDRFIRSADCWTLGTKLLYSHCGSTTLYYCHTYTVPYI